MSVATVPPDRFTRAALLVVVALLVGLTSVPALAAKAPDTGQDTCSRVVVDSPPQWATRGVFTRTGNLVFVDSWDHELTEFQLNGRLASSGVTSDLQSTLRQLRPVSIQPTESGSVVLLENQELVFLNQDFGFERLRNVAQEAGFGDPFASSAPADTSFVMLPPFEITGESIVACGTRRQGDKSERGYFRVDLAGGRGATLLKPLAGESTAFLFCRILGPFIASVGPSGQGGAGVRSYVLVMGENPAIYRADEPMSEASRLAAFPAGFEELPDISPFRVGQDLESLMQQFQYSKMPVAMYGQGKHLFVLTREPAGAGTSTWRLTKIDPGSRPEEARVVGSVEIPTDSAHVFAVPGSRYWAFVERGPAGGWYDPHPVESVLLIPNREIAGIGEGVSRVCK